MKIKSNEQLVRFGAHVRMLRESKLLGMRELSTLCNVHQSNLSKIEAGLIDIRLSTILELAEGLGVHPKKLLDFKL